MCFFSAIAVPTMWLGTWHLGKREQEDEDYADGDMAVMLMVMVMGVRPMCGGEQC